LEFHRHVTNQKNKKMKQFGKGAGLGHGTIVVLGVDGEAELLDEELADLGPALPGGEVQRGALVGVPHAGGHGRRALPFLVKRRAELCSGSDSSKSK
jgi:hypothetical protein